MECEDFPRNQKNEAVWLYLVEKLVGRVLGECTICWATNTDTSKRNGFLGLEIGCVLFIKKM